MVMNILSSLLTSNNQTRMPDRPVFNSIPYTSGSSRYNGYGGLKYSYQQWWRDFKRSPELVSVLQVPITDAIGDRPEFVDLNGKALGRNKMNKAKKFWRDNRLKETIKAMMFDMFVTGDGYLWKGKMTPEERMKAVKEYLTPKLKLLTKEAKAEFMIKASQDEDLKRVKRVDYVASSTMDIIHDQKEIIGYRQQTNSYDIKFTPEEIVHFRYFTMDGRVEGFSPVQALSAEIYLLWMIKQNMVSFLNNGGTPSKLFVLPDEFANSQNHRFLVETLSRYQSVQNRNGNLVFTGKVELQDLAGSPRDLEYKDLTLLAASNIAFSYGVPVTRIPYLLGSAATNGDSGGLSESGYWNRISELQDQLEDLLNNQIFEELDFNVQFNRKYKQDEVREAQTFSMNADTITKVQSMLKQHNKTLDEDYIAQVLKIPMDQIRELTEEEKSTDIEKTGLMNRNLMRNIDLEKEPDNRKRANTKRDVVNSDETRIASV